VGFRIVPTWDKTDTASELKSSSDSDKGPVPGLLLLSQNVDEDGGIERKMRIIRCPVGNITEWALEVGLMPVPRETTEVLPGKSPVTVSISGKIFYNSSMSVFVGYAWTSSQ
jgi:hypothetical protein